VPPITAGGQRLFPVDRTGDFVALAGEVEGECLTEGAVVFDDQDRSLQFRSSICPVAR
jgi:hypothetical protein